MWVFSLKNQGDDRISLPTDLREKVKKVAEARLQEKVVEAPVIVDVKEELGLEDYID